MVAIQGMESTTHNSPLNRSIKQFADVAHRGGNVRGVQVEQGADDFRNGLVAQRSFLAYLRK